jgi:hypothetical protein
VTMCSAMSLNRRNFESWFVKVLESLYPCGNAGFVMALTAFPLLERYLRSKAGLSAHATIDEKFKNELLRVFPELATKDKANEFWQVYRHGLLHLVTFSETNRRGDSLSAGSFRDHGPIISIDPRDGSFSVNHVSFTQRVIQIIIGDFPAFEGAELPQLPVVKPYRPPSTDTPYPYLPLGTSKP